MKIKITLDNGDTIEATHSKDMTWIYRWAVGMQDDFVKVGDAILNRKHIVSIIKVED